MVATRGLETRAMAKTRGRPPSGRSDVSVKVDRAVIAKAKLVAAHRGVTLAELVTDLLRGPVDHAFAAMARELDRGSK